MIDNRHILQLHKNDLPAYLSQLLTELSEEVVTAQLFASARSESLPPTIFTLWLSIATQPKTLLQALEQDFSVFIRTVAIRRFRNLLQGEQWKQVWDGIGSTSGILSLLATFSVLEIRDFVKCVRRSTKGLPAEGKREKITELLRGLLPSLFPDALFKTSDNRPLIRLYKILIPACSSKFVDGLLHDKKSSLMEAYKITDTKNALLIKEHPQLFKAYYLDLVFKPTSLHKGLNFDLDTLGALIQAHLPPQSPKKGYTESMLFSWNLLNDLSSRPDIEVKGFSILKTFIQPLLCRARAKRMGWPEMGNLLDLTLIYLNSHPNERAHLKLVRSAFLYFCILSWAKSTGLSTPEARLTSALQMIPQQGQRNQSGVSDYAALLKWVPRDHRYRLLRILVLNCGVKPIDIDILDDLKSMPSSVWPCTIFTDVDVESALKLLGRLQEVPEKHHYLKATANNSILYRARGLTSNSPNDPLLGILLERGKPGALDRATVFVNENKTEAQKSREQTDRANFARRAMFLAAASGSIQLYGDTLKWANRFVKDPLTVATLFSHQTMTSEEGLRLLSGVPWNVYTSELPTPLEIKGRVLAANKILFSLFETACLAVKEPSFYAPHWTAYSELIDHVVVKRMELIGTVKNIIQISDENIYDILWSDTIDTLLRRERILLDPEYMSLSGQDTVGKSGNYRPNQTEGAFPFMFRVIDSLAKGRDAIWREFRRSVHPSAAALPPQLPRGLPLQCLSPYIDVAVETAHGLTPFIFSRAEAIVFQNPKAAFEPLPEDRDTISAVGRFVDPFHLALKIYIFQGATDAIREERTKVTWDYALKNLSKGMSQDEAHRTWKTRFQQAMPKFQIAGPDPEQNMEYPLILHDSNTNNLEDGICDEWNPGEDFLPLAVVKSRPLVDESSSTYFDSSIYASDEPRFGINSALVNPNPVTTGFQPKTISLWDLGRLLDKNLRMPAITEGLIVSALQYLELKLKPSEYILSKPFPSQSDIRYPSLWLDVSCMEDNTINSDKALSILEHFSHTVPPTLIYRLARHGVTQLLATEKDFIKPSDEFLVFKLLQLLARGHRPYLASGLILEVIIQKPDASAWHRDLLNTGSLKRLSGGHTKNLLKGFSQAIYKALQEYSIAQKSGDKSKPFVKITTIKYLAQLLRASEIVDEGFAVETLAGLFEKSTHVDVRVAAVDSLLSMILPCHDEKPSPSQDRIYKVLECAIPIASRFDEGCLILESDWDNFKHTGELPEPYTQGNSERIDLSIPPVLTSLLGKCSISQLGLGGQKHYLERILLPILAQSTAINTRWLQIFSVKHGLDLPSLDLPLLPVKPKLLKNIVAWSDATEQCELWHLFVQANIAPPKALKEFLAKLRKTDLRQLPETKHFLSLYGHGLEAYSYDSFNLSSRLLCAHGDQITKIQAYVEQTARTLLLDYPLPAFTMFMSKLSEPTACHSSHTIWTENFAPLIENLIAYIDSLRTSEWQRNPNRQPPYLPSTLQYRLWLLPYPQSSNGIKSDIPKFVEAVISHLTEITAKHNAYHRQFSDIESAIKNNLAQASYYNPHVACLLGDLQLLEGQTPETFTTVDYLRVELAFTVFQGATWNSSHGDEKYIGISKRVREGWRGSEVERFRKLGELLARRHTYLGYGGWADLMLPSDV